MELLGQASLKYRTSVLVMTTVFVLGGLVAYDRMGRLEDPEFTIKQLQVITPFPGATAQEVEEQVTDLIERSVQALGQVDSVRSTSTRGQSTVDVVIKDHFGKALLPQVWDEVRRKVSDVQSRLPQGAGPSMVYDDFGDVYGVFFALTGDGYDVTELRDMAKFLQRELLTVRDVAKVALVGVQQEAIHLELSPARMARFGVTREQIFAALQDRNVTVDSGTATVGETRVALRPTGDFTTAEEIGGLLIGGASGGADRPVVFLRDIAQVTRGLREPATFLLRVDGRPAVGMAISTVKGGNVVTMGQALKARVEALIEQRLVPFGVEFHPISIQS